MHLWSCSLELVLEANQHKPSNFKELFNNCARKSLRERDYPTYDVVAEIDRIDWDAIVDPSQSFHENLEDLKNDCSARLNHAHLL